MLNARTDVNAALLAKTRNVQEESEIANPEPVVLA
jgi:hypothetical protein